MPTLLANKIYVTGAMRVIRPPPPTGATCATDADALPTGRINFLVII